MPLVDRVVADGLALEVVADREDLEVVLLQELQLGRHIRVVLDRGPRIEVVAPAGDLQPVVPPARGQSAHLFERQVGPLAGEQGDRSGHGHFSSCGVVSQEGISCQESVSELVSTAARTRWT